MARVPVKLTRGEIVLPPGVTQQYRQRLEEMNALGLQARAAGGVVAYRQAGGFIPPELAKFFQQQGGGAPAPAPRGAAPAYADNYGAALVNIGQKEFLGASEALSRREAEEAKGAIEAKLAELDRLLASGVITQEQYDKMKADLLSSKTTDEEKEALTKEETIKLAREAGTLLQGAAQAGDFINGHNQDLTTKEQEEVDDAEKGWFAQVSADASALISTAAGAFSQTAKVREEALKKIAYRKYPESYRDYTRLNTVANKLVFPVLESGALGVNPTDADTQLARESTFDITAPSTTWASQLNDLINREGGVGEIIDVLAKKTGNQETVQGVNSGNTTVNTSNVGVEPQGASNTNSLIATEGPEESPEKKAEGWLAKAKELTKGG